jgi:4-hydroxy-4-methyl-2-oxoglutarate aldolase
MPAPADLAAALLRLGAATLGESGGHPMRARIRPVWSGARLAAPAYPVRSTAGDNLAVHVAVARAPAGAALVVDVGDEPERGYWGEVLTTGAEARGLTGLVIDGCVRDTSALAQHGFPVFAVGTALPGATKQRPGRIGDSAVVGGVTVRVGDWLVGDADGVTVIPGGEVESVLTAGLARAEKEERFFAELRGGATTLDLLGLDASSIDRDA